MKKINVPAFSTPTGATKVYGAFAGVDYSGDETKIADNRSPHAVNLIADEGGFPEKRVGWRTLHQFDGCVSGIFHYIDSKKAGFIVHAGAKLYMWDGKTATELLAGLVENGRDAGFYMNSKLYILTGREYIVYDGEAAKHVSEDAYIPTTTDGASPRGGGTPYEKLNLISPYRKNTFICDGSSIYYYFDTKDLDEDFVPEVMLEGEPYTGKVFFGEHQAKNGYVTFENAPPVPTIDGVPNLEIKFKKTVEGDAEKITKCTICATFGLNSDSRVFVAGNPDEPNREQYSGLYDPTYFPDLNYVLIGSDDFPIMCYLKSQGELLAIKQDNRQEGTVWHHTAELDSDGTMTFPLKEGVPGYGAIARYSAASLLDDPMYLSPRGVYAPTTTLTYAYVQRALKCRSGRVNMKLNKETGMENAVAGCWRGWYVLAVNGHAYVADGNQPRSDDGYEWYYWDNIPAHVMRAHEQTLYFGTKDGRLCRFNDDIVSEQNEPMMKAYNDDGASIPVEWATKLDTMDTMQRLKTMPKRGSGIHLKAYCRSKVEILVRTERDFGKVIRTVYADKLDFNDVSFERFTFSTVNNSMIPFRTKKKKWKAIQIIARQDVVNEGFGVHEIVVRFVYAGYAKRQ